LASGADIKGAILKDKYPIL